MFAPLPTDPLNVRMKCDVPATSPAFVTRFFAGEVGVSGCTKGPTVVVRRTHRHEVVRRRQNQDCVQRLTDLSSPQPCAD
jgi:hypothetical protein